MRIPFLRRRPKTTREPRTFTASGGLFFLDWEKRSVFGWSNQNEGYIPCPGDYLLTPMESGKVARFRFTEVRDHPGDSTSFGGTVEDDRYLPEGGE